VREAVRSGRPFRFSSGQVFLRPRPRRWVGQGLGGGGGALRSAARAPTTAGHVVNRTLFKKREARPVLLCLAAGLSSRAGAKVCACKLWSDVTPPTGGATRHRRRRSSHGRIQPTILAPPNQDLQALLQLVFRASVCETPCSRIRRAYTARLPLAPAWPMTRATWCTSVHQNF